MTRVFWMAAIVLMALVGGADAGSLDALLARGVGHTADRSVIAVDWQDPTLLPAAFRNHCTIDRWTGRTICSNHCGSDYEFYFCTPASFGCCRVGYGYCDGHGDLRCHP